MKRFLLAVMLLCWPVVVVAQSVETDTRVEDIGAEPQQEVRLTIPTWWPSKDLGTWRFQTLDELEAGAEFAMGQPGNFRVTTLIDSSRRIDWTTAGATIISRSTVCVTAACNTMTAAGTSATAAQINAAIASTSNTVVLLACGTYALAGGIDFNNTSNVTVRGCGPQGAANGGTHLTFSADTSCYGSFSDICIRNSDNNWSGHGDGAGAANNHNYAAWTAGYAAGTTSIVIDPPTIGVKPPVGMMLTLDQVNDVDTDTGNIWICTTDNVCADEGGGAFAREAPDGIRAQQQFVKVTAISSGACPCTVTISPGLYMPNWRTGQHPGAWWSNALPITGVGLEDLSLDHTGSTSWGAITIYNGYGNWIKNVKSYNAKRAHVLLYQAAHNTIRDSYFDEDQSHAQQRYGIESFLGSDNKIENDIFHHVTLPISINGSASGTVIGYCYLIDNTYTPSATFMIAGYGQHEGGVDFVLYEGNDGQGFISDGIHGSHHFLTAFRNYFRGWETGKTQQTNPVKIYAYGRYINLVGNVLGTDGYHTTYAGGGDLSIYDLGASPGSGVPTDSQVAATLFRWGNYDTVNDAATWSAGEVPSGLSQYANAVPATHTLPRSLYLIVKPPFFGSKPWPGIGPDVTGGDITGVGGTAFKNPARLCYENGMKDVNGQLTAFNPNAC